MKKALIFVFFLFFAYGNSIFGQTNTTPIIGYDKMTWGTTVTEFIRLYPGAKETTSSDDEYTAVGQRLFEQTNVGGGISRRTFYFYQNKLYAAQVDYVDVDNSTGIILLEKLASTYGKFDDKEESTGRSGTLYTQENTLFRYYNAELTVIFGSTEFYNAYNYKIGLSLTIIYRNEKTVDLINIEKRKKQGEKLNL